MKIKILKDHESGLKKDGIHVVPDPIASKLIANGLAEEVKAKPRTTKKK